MRVLDDTMPLEKILGIHPSDLHLGIFLKCLEQAIEQRAVFKSADLTSVTLQSRGEDVGRMAYDIALGAMKYLETKR